VTLRRTSSRTLIGAAPTPLPARPRRRGFPRHAAQRLSAKRAPGPRLGRAYLFDRHRAGAARRRRSPCLGMVGWPGGETLAQGRCTGLRLEAPVVDAMQQRHRSVVGAAMRGTVLWIASTWRYPRSAMPVNATTTSRMRQAAAGMEVVISRTEP
jgi:hypothetical protein